MSSGTIVAVCISKHKGTPKKNVGEGTFREGFGLVGDAHGGDWHRQVSLLSSEEIAKMNHSGLDVAAGSFAENLTTENFDLASVTVGDRLKVGDTLELEITQIGKECHTRCAVYHKVGDCIMPKQGVFARVLKSGDVKVGDVIIKTPGPGNS
ncbi:MAG: MOSC domain-containing protein [Pseudomonadota bacterium]